MSILKIISELFLKPKAEPIEANLRNCNETALREYFLLLGVEQTQCLHVHNTRVAYLPESVGRLTQLTELDLSCNVFCWLPDEMKNLKKLEILNLSQNKFKVFPLVLTKISTLKSLDLSMNEITVLPSALLKLRKLTTLNLEGNDIKLPLPGCQNLTVQEIFNAFKARVMESERRNMWTSWKPFYNEAPQGCVKTLVDLCTDCILDHEVDFKSGKHIPPVVKTYLTEEEHSCGTSKLLPSVMKCSVCKKYFSSKHNFIHHQCF